MPYFTLKKEGRPIAKVIGGRHNNKIIYLVENDEEDNYDDLSFIPKNMMFPLKKEIMGLRTGKKQEMEFLDGKLMPLPRLDKRESLYIAGPEGSGKSYYAAMYAKQFKKVFPKKDFIIFSRKEDDEPLDELNPMRISLNEEIVDEPIELKEVADSLVLFDDIDRIRDKQIKNSVDFLKNSILDIGRSDEIYVITTAHNLTAGKETKHDLIESSSVTFYPNAGDNYHIDYFLKKYCGLKDEQVKRIQNLKSRWVTIYKRAPVYILYERGVYLISNK